TTGSVRTRPRRDRRAPATPLLVASTGTCDRGARDPVSDGDCRREQAAGETARAEADGDRAHHAPRRPGSGVDPSRVAADDALAADAAGDARADPRGSPTPDAAADRRRSASAATFRDRRALDTARNRATSCRAASGGNARAWSAAVVAPRSRSRECDS